MELVMFGKELLQSAAEQVASYRVGQSALRHLDRALLVIEKCARWAVPPPLDQDERAQPELVRPLPWVFFLTLLITLRITRESISLINLVMGKPPLRSADVVMYIQSKRRYLRMLKYQGNRMMRARSVSASAQQPRSWYSHILSLLEFTMCFRHSRNYGNNNTTHVSNNDEVLVVKRSKRVRQSASPTRASGTTMERLIERMMLDLDADSDDDSSYTLTNVTSIRSDRSETAESDQDTILHQTRVSSTPADVDPQINESPNRRGSEVIAFSPDQDIASTPRRETTKEKHGDTDNTNTAEHPNSSTDDISEANEALENNRNDSGSNNVTENNHEVRDNSDIVEPMIDEPKSVKEETVNFIQMESGPDSKTNVHKKERKYANGRVGGSSEKRKAGLNNERRVTRGPAKSAD